MIRATQIFVGLCWAVAGIITIAVVIVCSPLLLLAGSSLAAGGSKGWDNPLNRL